MRKWLGRVSTYQKGQRWLVEKEEKCLVETGGFKCHAKPLELGKQTANRLSKQQTDLNHGSKQRSGLANRLSKQVNMSKQTSTAVASSARALQTGEASKQF